MQKFTYTAKDTQGRTRKGLVEALDEKNAVKILQTKDLLVISLAPVKETVFTEINRRFFRRITTNDRVNFTRQMATMIASGLQITDALSIFEGQASPAMTPIVSDILKEVESGGSFNAALAKYPHVFDRVYISLVKAGETAGVLDTVLNRLADNLENKREFNAKIKAAMIYPAIVVLGMILVAAIMILFVVPKLTVLYEEFSAELPFTTRILISVSRFANQFWWLFPLPIIGFFFILPPLLKYKAVKKGYDEIMFRLPIIGPLRKAVMFTEFTRTLALLVGSGVLIVDALEVVKGATDSPIYEEALESIARNVQKGFPLAAAIGNENIFPPIIPQMISVGEETGKLGEVLEKVSNYFLQESEQLVKGLTAAIEPIIMILLGVGVGFLMVSIIMPIYNLTSKF